MKHTNEATLLLGVSIKDAPRRFRPLGDRLLLERAKPEEVTAGGILLPVGADNSEKIHVSIVRALGPQVDGDEIGVAVGSWVTHLPYATETVTINGQEFGVCRVDDILGVLEQ